MLSSITPISNNNPNFEGLVVSKKTLRGLGCKRKDLLNKEFIKQWSDICDVYISSDATLFKKATQFALTICEKVKIPLFSRKPQIDNIFSHKKQFNKAEELDDVINKIKDDFYLNFAINKYKFEFDALTWLRKGNTYQFWQNTDRIIHNIAGIPDKPEYKKLREYFLFMLKDMKFWKPVKQDSMVPYSNGNELSDEKTVKTAGLRAIESNNIELLKFLKEKGENLNQCLDLMKNGNVSDEVKEILKDVKYQDPKIFELEEVVSSEYLLSKFLEKNKDIDINSRNEAGDTLVHKAVKDGNINLLKYLQTRDDVNWNIYNLDVENAAMLALKNKDAINLLKIIPKDKIDINAKSSVYGSKLGSGEYSPLIFAISVCPECIDSLLEFKNANVMIEYQEQYKVPAVYRAMLDDMDRNYIVSMLKHPSFDIHCDTGLKNLTPGKIASPKYLDIFSNAVERQAIREAKNIYEKEGELTLDQIEMFIKSFYDESLLRIEHVSLNSIGDTVGHLLCDTHVDLNDYELMKRMSKILDDLIEHNFKFQTKNELGETIFDKAVEYENVGLVRLLLDKCCFTLTNFREKIENCKNEEIKKILSSLHGNE